MRVRILDREKQHLAGLSPPLGPAPRETQKLRSKLAVDWVDHNFSTTELGKICGRDSIAFIGVRASTKPESGDLSDILHQEIMRLNGFYSAVGCNDLPDGCIT